MKGGQRQHCFSHSEIQTYTGSQQEKEKMLNRNVALSNIQQHTVPGAAVGVGKRQQQKGTPGKRNPYKQGIFRDGTLSTQTKKQLLSCACNVLIRYKCKPSSQMFFCNNTKKNPKAYVPFAIQTKTPSQQDKDAIGSL